MDTVVSEDGELICRDILVPTESLMVDTAWVHVSRGDTRLARKTGDSEPEIEGTEVVSVEGTTATPILPDNPRLGIGRPIAALSQTTPPTPPDCTQVSWIPPGRASGDRLLLSISEQSQ